MARRRLDLDGLKAAQEASRKRSAERARVAREKNRAGEKQLRELQAHGGDLVKAVEKRKQRLEELQIVKLERELALAPGAASVDADERTERHRVPIATFWFILERRFRGGKTVTVNGLSEETRRGKTRAFVGRTRMTRFVDWIDKHPDQAEHALSSSKQLHDIPPQFRATERGVLIP